MTSSALLNATVMHMASASLPEMASLSSVTAFIECFLSGTRQRGYLSSTIKKTLDKQIALSKEVVCRVPSTRQTITLGKDQVCRVSGEDTRQRVTAVNGRQPPLTLCRVSSPDTRQRGDVPSVRQTIFFHF